MPDATTATTTALGTIAATGDAAAQQAAQAAAAASATSTTTTTGGDFLESSPKDWKLPDDLKDYRSLEKFPKGIELVRAYKNLEGEFSKRQQIKPPGEGSKPEEVQAWRELMGVPKTPDEYGLKAPEKLPEGVVWNEAFAKEFATLAHAENLPPATVQKLVDFHNASLSKMQAGAVEQQTAAMETAKAALATAWGADVVKNSALAIKMAETLGVKDPASNPAIGNNPEIVQMLHKAAEMMNALTKESGPLIKGDSASWGDTAQAAYDKIVNSDDFMGKNGPAAADAAVKRLEAIHNSMQKIVK